MFKKTLYIGLIILSSNLFYASQDTRISNESKHTMSGCCVCSCVMLALGISLYSTIEEINAELTASQSPQVKKIGQSEGCNPKIYHYMPGAQGFCTRKKMQ